MKINFVNFEMLKLISILHLYYSYTIIKTHNFGDCMYYFCPEWPSQCSKTSFFNINQLQGLFLWIKKVKITWKYWIFTFSCSSDMPVGSTEDCVVVGPKLCKAEPAADSLEF